MSPVVAMEPTLLDLVVWKQEVGQAIMPKEVLSLANYLLVNSTVQQTLTQFEVRIKRKGTD